MSRACRGRVAPCRERVAPCRGRVVPRRERVARMSHRVAPCHGAPLGWGVIDAQFLALLAFIFVTGRFSIAFTTLAALVARVTPVALIVRRATRAVALPT
eukprot:2652308-Prymnesium_polylepis.1